MCKVLLKGCEGLPAGHCKHGLEMLGGLVVSRLHQGQSGPGALASDLHFLKKQTKDVKAKL